MNAPSGSELRRRLRVTRGLARIELYERLGERTGRRLARMRRRSRAPTPLRKWERISESSFAAYTRASSAARIGRLVDLVPPNRRILDVGIGYGYVTGVVLRDLRPSYYCGIDLRESFLDATRDMIAANGLEGRAIELEVLDVFEIDAGFVRGRDPDVVLLLEVLEHVSAPAGALAAVASAVEPGTTILFTVPLCGRLDGVWGHASIFDRRRLQRICRQAGLTIERAEPVHNTWSLVVAKTTGTTALAGRGLEPGEGQQVEPGYTFSRVSVSGPPERYRRPSDGSNVMIKPSRAHLRCLIHPANGHPGGGVRLEMRNPRVARMELSIDPPDAVRTLRIEGLDDAGAARLEWVGEARDREIGKRTTYVLRPGEPARALAPTGGKDPEGVRWMDVSVEPESGRELTLTVHRAAYLA